MGDLLRQGARWLEQMRTAHCASPVTYRRDGVELNVQATFGRTAFEIADEGGLTIQAQVWDFLVLADELAVLGTPQGGDAIVTGGRQYEVMDLAGEGCWRWSDPYRTSYRIHTKDIGPAS